MADHPTVQVSRRAADRLRQGHPWVFRSDVERADAVEPGAAVVLSGPSPRGAREPLGTAIWSSKSAIAARRVDERTVRVDRAFFVDRLTDALAWRERDMGGLPHGFRWIHAEGDRLPGLVVDRIGDQLSVQLLTEGMDLRQKMIVDALVAIAKPAAVVLRNDAPVREKEGLARTRTLVHGTASPVRYREGDITLVIDLVEGQKTGTFLDQRDNHLHAGKLARGRGLDVCSGDGGFALQLARGGCAEVLAVDGSEPAVERIRHNAVENGLGDVVRTRAGDAFEVLRALVGEGARFDIVVVDPPAFARGRQAVEGALRGYKDLNLHAMRLLAPGGVLVTCSCSQPVTPGMFDDMLADAAADAHRSVRILCRRGAGVDHPVMVGFPEGDYLKCVTATVEE